MRDRKADRRLHRRGYSTINGAKLTRLTRMTRLTHLRELARVSRMSGNSAGGAGKCSDVVHQIADADFQDLRNSQ